MEPQTITHDELVAMLNRASWINEHCLLTGTGDELSDSLDARLN